MADIERQRPADFIHDFFTARAQGEDVSTRCSGKLVKFERWLFQTKNEVPKIHERFTFDSANVVKEDEASAVVDLRGGLSYFRSDVPGIQVFKDSILDGPAVLQKVDSEWRMVDFTRDGRSAVATSHEHNQTFAKRGYDLEVEGLILGGAATHVIGTFRNGTSAPAFIHTAALMRPFFRHPNRTLGGASNIMELSPGERRLLRIGFDTRLRAGSRSFTFVLPVLDREAERWTHLWVPIRRQRG